MVFLYVNGGPLTNHLQLRDTLPKHFNNNNNYNSYIHTKLLPCVLTEIQRLTCSLKLSLQYQQSLVLEMKKLEFVSGRT